MENLKHVSDIIDSAGKGLLPFIALGLLVLGFIALKWFGKDGQATRIFIFLTIVAIVIVAVWVTPSGVNHPPPPEPRRSTLRATIYFRIDSSDLSPEAVSTLDEIAAEYSITRQRIIRLEGHTDRMGSTLVNKEYSIRFAVVAKDYLVEQGVPRQTIIVDGLGESRPISTNSAQREPQDRRVDIYFDD